MPLLINPWRKLYANAKKEKQHVSKIQLGFFFYLSHAIYACTNVSFHACLRECVFLYVHLCMEGKVRWRLAIFHVGATRYNWKVYLCIPLSVDAANKRPHTVSLKEEWKAGNFARGLQHTPVHWLVLGMERCEAISLTPRNLLFSLLSGAQRSSSSRISFELLADFLHENELSSSGPNGLLKSACLLLTVFIAF